MRLGQHILDFGYVLVGAPTTLAVYDSNFGNLGNALTRDPLLIAHAAHELVWISLKLFQAIE